MAALERILSFGNRKNAARKMEAVPAMAANLFRLEEEKE
jgi:hypothetical protein